jgi:HEAT repeat protein
MNKKLLIGLRVVALVCLLVCLVLLFVPMTWISSLVSRRDEGLYKSQPASYWVPRLRDPNEEVRSDALTAVVHLGPWAKDAIPTLLEMMTEQDGQFETYLSEDDRRGFTSIALIEILKGLGPDMEEHIPSVVKLLDSKDRITRYHTLELLGKLGPHARAAIPALRKAIRDPEGPFIHHSVAKALGAIDREALVRALIEALDDEHSGVRGDAAENLGKLGKDAKAAIPKLRELRQVKEDFVRSSARDALKEIDPGIGSEPD